MNEELSFFDTIMKKRYSWDEKENWKDIAHRVVTNVYSVVPVSKEIIQETEKLICERKFIPGGRFLAQAGRPYHQTSNCFMLRAEDTREGWSEVVRKATVMLMSGGGLGVDYSQIRANGSVLKSTGGTASGPIPLIKTVNEVARGVMCGGSRRSAVFASISWEHQDIFSFIQIKNWPDYIRKQKEVDFNTPAPVDMTNISVILNKEFFNAFDTESHGLHSRATEVYWKVIERMLKTGEPGFQIDYNNPLESLRNACCEVTSEDDCDVCVLGSVNFSKVESIEELQHIVEVGTIFLLAGTEYTDVPVDKVRIIQQKNRRIGLGAMGLAEWFVKRNKRYGPDEELGNWLKVWADASRETADYWANKFNWNRSIALRAIAPNGTISIAGGQTTGGIEPIFSVAYKRRYLDGRWKEQYVIDPVAERLIKQGISVDKIEDAYTLSLDVERRVAFQAFTQQYVDNAISSTLNLPPFGERGNDAPEEFGKMLYKYLPKLRGITCYPNGARGGQPITPVPYEFAMKHRNKVFEANENCAEGICGL